MPPDVSLSLPGCDAEPLRAFETVAVADHSSLLSHSSRALWIKPRTLQRSPDLQAIDAAANSPAQLRGWLLEPFRFGRCQIIRSFQSAYHRIEVKCLVHLKDSRGCDVSATSYQRHSAY
jgi:hypothetical protein